MMSGRTDAGKKTGGDGRLLQEIEALGRALYLNKNPPKSLVSTTSDVRSKSAGKTHFRDSKLNTGRFVKEESSQRDKKSSIWNWKPLKALSHIRNRRFSCSFSLQVHSVEGLSPDFDDTSLCIHWRRRDGGLQTRPAKVFHGRAEFEETLTYKCSVYGSGNGPHHSAKYEAKHCLLYASVVGALDLDLGKHRIDMTRLLPLTLEELEDEKSSGKWTTSFKLSYKAKGASLNVSLGYVIGGDNLVESHGSNNASVPFNVKQNKQSSAKSVMGFHRGDARGMLQRSGSLASIPKQRSHPQFQSKEDIKILHEVLPSSKSELSGSAVSLLDQKLDEGKVDGFAYSKPEFEVFSGDDELLKPKTCTLSETGKENLESECEDNDFTVVEQGIEMPTKATMKLEESSMQAIDGAIVENTELDENGENDVLTQMNLVDGALVEPSEADEMKKKDVLTDRQPDAMGDSSHKSGEELSLDNSNSTTHNNFHEESAIGELESAFQSLSIFEPVGLDNPQMENEAAEEAGYSEVKSNYKASKIGKSLSLDDVTESVASEFLSMLGIEHSPFGLSSDSDPESPRERLLRQFEKDALAGGGCIFDFGMETELVHEAPTPCAVGNSLEDLGLSSVVEAAEAEHQRTTQYLESKARAKMLENFETEALMREWGLNEKAFQSSPRSSASGFGSPIDLPPEGGPFELPSLGDGLDPCIQTRDGGFLRSMNPTLFRNAKNCGSLIMQVSSPVVVPAEMGSGIMEILQNLASVGIEKLSIQANKLMPLEDITGKTMQQVAWEALPCLEAPERQGSLQLESGVMQDALSWGTKSKGSYSGHKSSNLNSSLSGEMGSEYVSLEDLAPLAMDKIEALSIEGLRIQSGMSDEEAPSNISPQAIGELSALEGRKANNNGYLGMEGAGGLQLLDIKDSGNDVDGLMGLSLTLDEWLKLDAGIIDEEDEISERTSKILAAHHANSIAGWKGDKRRGKGSGKRCGLLGNNFTVALMVQLRDPLRNYEPVGTPMLSLIQVERVFVPPKPKIYSTVSERRYCEEEEESESLAKETKEEVTKKSEEEETIPQFKITEVHVAGLKPEPEKKKLWGSSKQQQSGSRWLLASGMGKSNKHPFMKSKAPVAAKSSLQATTTVQPGDTLWSISARVHGTGAKWKDLAALNPHIRNPNVIFPNEKIRLR